MVLDSPAQAENGPLLDRALLRVDLIYDLVRPLDSLWWGALAAEEVAQLLLVLIGLGWIP